MNKLAKGVWRVLAELSEDAGGGGGAMQMDVVEELDGGGGEIRDGWGWGGFCSKPGAAGLEVGASGDGLG